MSPSFDATLSLVILNFGLAFSLGIGCVSIPVAGLGKFSSLVMFIVIWTACGRGGDITSTFSGGKTGCGNWFVLFGRNTVGFGAKTVHS